MKLKIDTHVHSIVSGHAFNTIQEIFDYSNNNDIELVCITDHGPSMQGAAQEGYFYMLSDIPMIIGDCIFLAGSECNILNQKGYLDLKDNILESLDIVLAGLHKMTPFNDKKGLYYNTEAIVNTMNNNLVDIISHPYRNNFPVDINKIVDTAYYENIILEVNYRVFLRNDTNERIQLKKMLDKCFAKGVFVVVGTDAHIIYDIGNISDDFYTFISEYDKIIIKKPEELLSFLLSKRKRNKFKNTYFKFLGGRT
jgi:putative hydrolase